MWYKNDRMSFPLLSLLTEKHHLLYKTESWGSSLTWLILCSLHRCVQGESSSSHSWLSSCGISSGVAHSRWGIPRGIEQAGTELVSLRATTLTTSERKSVVSIEMPSVDLDFLLNSSPNSGQVAVNARSKYYCSFLLYFNDLFLIIFNDL